MNKLCICAEYEIYDAHSEFIFVESYNFSTSLYAEYVRSLYFCIYGTV